MADPTDCTVYGSGCPGDAWKGYDHGVDGDPATADILLIGDSIATGGREYLTTALAAHNLSLCTDYWSGRPTEPAVNRLLSYSRLYQPDTFKAVILECGSNDITYPPAVGPQIGRVKAANLVPPVGWLSVYASRWKLSQAIQTADLRNTGLVNNQIYASGLPVLDWYGALCNKPTRIPAYLRDGLHPNEAGYKYWAAFLAPRIAQIAGV